VFFEVAGNIPVRQTASNPNTRDKDDKGKQGVP
jgi:hypothetical protein